MFLDSRNGTQHYCSDSFFFILGAAVFPKSYIIDLHNPPRAQVTSHSCNVYFLSSLPLRTS